MMEQVIRNFSAQFAYEPKVEHAEKLKPARFFIVAGMGGSALPARLLLAKDPSAPLFTHREYGVPALDAIITSESLFIAMSYSGNTEETLDALAAATAKGMRTAAITTGGKLLFRARAENIPCVKIPATGIQPRMADGFLLKALLKLMGREKDIKELNALASSFDASLYKKKGGILAQTVRGKIPVVYASARNEALAYNWKIKFNESAKIPAFWNVFPELNHNEMTGFDVIESTKKFSDAFHFIFLADENDHPRIQKRMEITRGLFQKRGLSVDVVRMQGHTSWERIFISLAVVDWAAYALALHYGTESEQVPMVEEFKKLM